MTDTTAASPAAPGPAAQGPPDQPAGTDSRFGPIQAIALIMGSIIGVGIFNLPTSLAGYGPITLISMGLTTIGALVLAMLFASLSRRLPADGGPYAYARVAFGNKIGFLNAWSYWITAWAGNAAIAVGWVLYVEQFINKGHNRAGSILLVLVGLWLPAMINLSGVKNMGSVQVVTTILKFAALAFMSTVGLFYIESANYSPWNVSGESAIAAIGGGMAIDARIVEATMPKAGTPVLERRLNWAGNRPSFAAASGISAQIIVQPFSAPKPEMMTMMAITLPGHVPPNMELTASEKGAVACASCELGRMPNIAVRESM